MNDIKGEGCVVFVGPALHVVSLDCIRCCASVGLIKIKIQKVNQ
jgi:hypothetical protein